MTRTEEFEELRPLLFPIAYAIFPPLIRIGEPLNAQRRINRGSHS